MKILIYGAGVVGSAYASRIKNAGYNATVLARGKRYEQLKNNGLILEDAETGEKLVTKLDIINELKPDDVYDYIIVTMRKNQVLEILPTLAENKSSTIIFMMNNLAGPEQLINALGRNKIILAFPSVAGKMENGVALVAISKENVDIKSTTFGELDGKITDRLQNIVEIIRKAGFYVRISNRIDDWLMTHGVFACLGAKVLAKNNCDNYQLAKSTEDIKLVIRLVREGFKVLEKNGYCITPAKYKFLYLPIFILVPLFKSMLNSKMAEISMSWHCKSAPDEFKQLEEEFKVLVNKSSIKMKAINDIGLNKH